MDEGKSLLYRPACSALDAFLSTVLRQVFSANQRIVEQSLLTGRDIGPNLQALFTESMDCRAIAAAINFAKSKPLTFSWAERKTNMRVLFSTVALAALVLASGCRNPTPSFNPYGAFGSPTVAPPPAGGYPASSVPGQANPYYPGIQQPAGVTPGPAPTYGQPGPATGSQSHNQTPAGTGNGWQATNSNSPAASTASNNGFQTNTAVNRAATPNITNGTINEAGYGGTGVQPANPASSLLDRIQRGRMPVHDATAPAGAAAPVPAPGYPAVPGYPVPVYPSAPAQPAYQVPPSMTSAPAYTQIRGAALTAATPNSTAKSNNSPAPVERSVLVATPSRNSPSANVATSSNAGSTSSGDGLKWRSKQAPVLEFAKR